MQATGERPQRGAFRRLLGVRNFRLLWGAGAFSAVGDQFDLIAFPWLVLMVTGDALAVGTVIAVGAVPTVIFMLLGGALADRFSPWLLLQASNVTRIAIGVALAALILAGVADLWLIYLFALLKGIADAFYYPAQAAILPRVVAGGELRQANAIVFATVEMGGFAGPVLAGGLIALFGGGGPAGERDLTGVGLAFIVVAGAFLVSSLLLLFMRVEKGAPVPQAADAEEPAGGVFASIAQGVRFVRTNAAMFTIFLLIAGVELLVEGPVIVGIPILADTKLAYGALALGIISSAFAGGSLLGSILAGTAPAPKRALGPVFTVLFVLMGLLLMPFGFLESLWLAAAITLVVGLAGGYTDILFTTWVQGHTPQRIMGRVMSLLMVAAVGVSPVSNAVSGALIKLSLEWVFVGAGALMAILCLTAGLRREVRTMGLQPELAQPPAPDAADGEAEDAKAED